MEKKKIAIFIISYQAVRTLISAIERIPASLKKKVEEIYVFDDCSDDNTYYAGIGYKHLSNLSNLSVYKNPKNLGYGGNQKRGYEYAIKKNYDIVVMLHGDVQYAPEEIPELIKPLEAGEADMVFGSRMKGHPLKGGMPLWKFIGNKSLTWVENKVLCLKLSEYHSGFRAYSVHALQKVPFRRLPNGYYFDTDIIIQFKIKGLRIKEISIPTHYGVESHKISFNKSVIYGLNIFKSLFQYWLHKHNLRKIHKFDFR